MTFKIGDIIIGNSKNNYGITNRKNKCEVIKIRVSDILVKVLEGYNKGSQFYVNPNKFNLVKSNINWKERLK